ncbi:hypothetical protein BGW42_008090 [Actinomortierella wolfii]|nr:hypothetical protein BGW42_008090 [Actinomortierella wolfii]
MPSQFPAQGRMPALIPQRTESLWYPFSSGVEHMHEELLEEEEHYMQMAREIQESGSHFIPIGMKRPYMQDTYHDVDEEEEGDVDEEEELEEDEDTPTEILGRHNSDDEEDQIDFDSPRAIGDEDDDTEFNEDEVMDPDRYVALTGDHIDTFPPSPDFYHMRLEDDNGFEPTTIYGTVDSTGIDPDEGSGNEEYNNSRSLRSRLAREDPISSAFDPYLQHHLRQGDEHDDDDGNAQVYDLDVPSDLSAGSPSASSFTHTGTTETHQEQVRMYDNGGEVLSSVQTPNRRRLRSQRDYWDNHPLSPTRFSPESPSSAIPAPWTTTTPRAQQQQQRSTSQRPSRGTPPGPQVLIYEDPPEPEDEEDVASLHSSPDDHHGYRYRL